MSDYKRGELTTHDKVRDVQEEGAKHANTYDLARGLHAKQRTRQHARPERTTCEPARHYMRNNTSDGREILNRWHVYTKQVLIKTFEYA
jgi:hypothetical protein